MRSWQLVLVGLLLAAACDAADTDADPTTRTCAPTLRRIADLDASSLPTLVGDHVVLAAGVPAAAYAVDTCGDADPVRLAGPDLELAGAFALATDAGTVAVGHRQATGELLLLDHLDEPGLDTPTVIATLDPTASGWFRWRSGLLLWNGPLMTETRGPSTVLAYPGPAGPDQPAITLADDVVDLARGGTDTFVALTDTGDLLDLADAAATVVHPHTRRFSLAPDGAQLVLQPQSSPTWSLHTLATADEIPLATAEASVARSTDPGTTTWLWTDTAVAHLDATGHLLSTHARSDGRRLAAPPTHDHARSAAGPLLFLTSSTRELAWNPTTDTIDEWYRGDAPVQDPHPVAAGIRYYVPGTRTTGQLWLHRPGIATPTLLQPEATLDAITLPDGRTVMSLPGPTDDRHRLVLLDEHGTTTPLATDVARWNLSPDPPQLTYAIAHGPNTGVWISPID